ncbi:putative phage abortive infection protein [Rahnella aceris]|uniref:putative phage abortive infection protein n=1 Tax=Rahnella sp. (strain Y9602) TaxID=2703885 RepID=UPI003FD3C473
MNEDGKLKKIYLSMSAGMKIATSFGVGAVLLIFAYAGFLVWVTWPIDKMTIANAGVFGDSFGILTSLFSALAFAGVAYTLAIQRDQIHIQKQELIEQKLETVSSRNEIQKQGFENTFFQMLKMHNQLISEITSHQSGARGVITKDGRSVIKDMVTKLKEQFARRELGHGNELDKIRDAFDDFYTAQGFQLAHYFRFLYNIFRYLSESNIENKELYVRLARAQISNQELFIIYYNALTYRGENFKKYIVEFKLMDNLEPQQLFKLEHRELIPDVGFQE